MSSPNSERAAAPVPMATLPEAARRRMAEIGPIWGTDIQKHRDIVVETYGPLLARAPKSGVTVSRDHAYGPHPRHRLDVFRPDRARGAPILVFVHGGAFIRGDKRLSDEVYDNVLYWFARQGLLAVNIEYRLAPEASFPGGAEDLARAVEWVRREGQAHGGDPDRIFLFGHSAGATHVGTYALDPHALGGSRPGIAGMIIASGRMRADTLPENPNAGGVRAYFGDDASLYEARSPVTYAERCDIPVMIAVAEFENPLLDVYCAEFFHRVAAARRHAPRFVRLTRHNHISIVAHFNTGEEILGREILDFIDTGR